MTNTNEPFPNFEIPYIPKAITAVIVESLSVLETFTPGTSLDCPQHLLKCAVAEAEDKTTFYVSYIALNCGGKSSGGLYGQLGCCGGRTMWNLGGNFSKFEQQRKQQDFLTVYLRHESLYMTKYFLVSTSQTRYYGESEEYLLGFLIKLGATQIDMRPNQAHASNNLHMFAWCPKDHVDKLREYVHISDCALTQDFYHQELGHFNPLWWTKLTDLERHNLITPPGGF